MTMQGRIKVGAPVFQDHACTRWPECQPPANHGEVDPNMIFEVRWNERGRGYWDCRADGFGFHQPKGGYGNGSIFVDGKENVELINAPAGEPKPTHLVAMPEAGVQYRITAAPEAPGVPPASSEDELEESNAVLMRLAGMLAEIAVAFKGIPVNPKRSYGYADLPAIARALADFAGRAAPVEASGVLTPLPDKPTLAQVLSACMSYRHDFGLLSREERDRLISEAQWWHHAWQKETALAAQGEPDAWYEHAVMLVANLHQQTGENEPEYSAVQNELLTHLRTRPTSEARIQASDGALQSALLLLERCGPHLQGVEQECCGNGQWSGHPDEPPECCGQAMDLSDHVLNEVRTIRETIAAAITAPQRCLKCGGSLPVTGLPIRTGECDCGNGASRDTE